ncbi:MAG: bifunctional hydroxymethylpyrimidine kinase/phosphomethylpyrimidine kinase [Marinifilaceae bacterium]
MKIYPKVLSIAGSDSGAGAGIQADLKTIAALGGYGMSAITAITAQNTRGVDGVHPVPAEMVRQQIQSVVKDIGADAVKIGMLHDEKIVKVVAEEVKELKLLNVVLDPVFLSTSGRALLQSEAIQTMQEHLFPTTGLITPNLPEAAFLLNTRIESIAQMRQAAKDLAQLGPTSVLVKGGHLAGELATDILYDGAEKKFYEYSSPKITTNNSHGTGCTLSSAIATLIASGLALPQAVQEAKAYLEQCLLAGSKYQIGTGNGPLCHFPKR